MVIVAVLTSCSASVRPATDERQPASENEVSLTGSPIGALLEEAERGNTQPLEELLATGTGLNGLIDGGPTLLMLASATGKTNVMEILLDRGAAIDLRDEQGATALMYAANAGELEVVEILLARGADVHARSTSGKTALQIANERKHTRVVRALERASGTARPRP